MNDAKQHSLLSSLPLASRLDRLDLLMKYLEERQNSWRLGSEGLVDRVEKQCVPLNLALQEADSKGSILDRVAFLEHRLIQMCLDMEASRALRSFKASEMRDPSSSHGIKKDVALSYPVFNKSNNVYKQESQMDAAGFEFQGNSQKLPLRLKQSSALEQKLGKKRDEKPRKSRKKANPPHWPHLRILGC